MDMGENKTFLLHGVTGSGKTEVYIACVRHALSLGKTAIVLVPEISITPQILAEFSRYFGREVAVFHSGLSDGERFDEWRRVQSGEARVVLGARSAVFLPLTNIGLILLDEEQAESYQAENHPPYHAAEIANMRCKMAGAPLVLASATPLVEDYAKAKMGIYELLEMPERIGKLPLPEMQIVDMKREYQRGNPRPGERRTLSGDPAGAGGEKAGDGILKSPRLCLQPRLPLLRRGAAMHALRPAAQIPQRTGQAALPLLRTNLCSKYGLSRLRRQGHAVYGDRDGKNAGAAANAFSRGAHPAHGF